MKNRIVGILVIAISVLIGFIIYSFNAAMDDIVNTSCSHGPSCPMWGTIDFQTNVSIAIMVFVIIIGLYLVFFGEEQRIITRIRKIRQQIEPRKITKENYQKVMSGMERDEKAILEKVIESQGTILQSDLISRTNINKVKVTRILDKMEGRGLIERRRRGMTNVIVLK
jgi:uncharacterized membrane protein